MTEIALWPTLRFKQILHTFHIPSFFHSPYRPFLICADRTILFQLITDIPVCHSYVTIE